VDALDRWAGARGTTRAAELRRAAETGLLAADLPASLLELRAAAAVSTMHSGRWPASHLKEAADALTAELGALPAGHTELQWLAREASIIWRSLQLAAAAETD